jgi:putative membrane protein insertion efficiency factor
MYEPAYPPRQIAHFCIRFYQLTLSALVGRHCRHLPTCSAFMDEAITIHGLWAGGWMGLGRLCRCHPWGTEGYDPVPKSVPMGAHWMRPWSYGRWRGPLECVEVDAEKSDRV